VAHRDAWLILRGALAWLMNVPDDAAAAAIARRSRHVFREGPLTPGQALAVARQALALGREVGPARAARWARAPRKGLLAAALIHLHGALAAHHAGAPADARARIALAHLAVGPIDDGSVGAPGDASFAAAWLTARALIGRAFWRAIRLGDPAAWARMVAVLRPPPPG
jgi:hypothetical protein